MANKLLLSKKSCRTDFIHDNSSKKKIEALFNHTLKK